MSLFFYLFIFAINLWHQKFVTADVTAVFIDNEDKILIEVCIWRRTHKDVDRRISKRSWTKRGVNKLLKKVFDTGTIDRRPGSGRPRSARTEENFATVNDYGRPV